MDDEQGEDLSDIEEGEESNCPETDRESKHIMSFKEFKGLKYIENIKDRYRIGKFLGKGQFGVVKKCLHKPTNIKLAIKIIEKELVA